jgi:hypothetical protein
MDSATKAWMGQLIKWEGMDGPIYPVEYFFATTNTLSGFLFSQILKFIISTNIMTSIT